MYLMLFVQARAKLMLVESQMQANKTVAVTAGALQNVAMTMKSLGSTLGSLNQRLSPQAIQRLSMNFERQVGQLGVKVRMNPYRLVCLDLPRLSPGGTESPGRQTKGSRACHDQGRHVE